VTKRACDVVIAGAGLLVLSPFLLVVAGLIKLTSPGPAVYRQWRVGQGGRHFRILKFRTMVQDADRLGTSVTGERDARITAVGRLLRHAKLDELPQLWNVLRGDMSLVGPRPDTPDIVATYTPEMRRILEVRPGLTSVATLRLRHEEQLLALVADKDEAYRRVLVPFKVKAAMIHVERRDLAFELALIAKTLWATIAGLWSAREDPVVTSLRAELRQFRSRER
jgi:lipopolysaccharide/colanic/teichoic acid biosynthesis glycosyltransferase